MFAETLLLIGLFLTFGLMLLVGFHIAYTLFGVSILFTLIAMISDQYFNTATGLDFYYFGSGNCSVRLSIMDVMRVSNEFVLSIDISS